jgi:hypothetical protein
MTVHVVEARVTKPSIMEAEDRSPTSRGAIRYQHLIEGDETHEQW